MDVLEVGTILCFAEGVRAVETIRALYPEHIVAADLKGADAGSVLAKMMFSRGATWMTVIYCAPYATMETARKTAETYHGDIQIELYGDWTFDHAAGKGWDEGDLDKITRLSKMGFDVSVTGGLSPEDLPQFKDIPEEISK